MEQIALLRNGEKICDETSIEATKFKDNFEIDKNINVRMETRSSKKTKRRSKALKAKMQKIKNADLAERLNLNIKPGKPTEPKLETKPIPEPPTEENLPVIECHSVSSLIEPEIDLDMFQKYISNCQESSIVDAIKTNILKEETEHPPIEKPATKNEWKQKILNLPFRNNYIPHLDSSHDGNASKSLNGPKLYSHLFGKKNDVNSRIESIIKYLCDLMEKIVQKYQRNWIIDEECEQEFFKDKTGKNKSYSILDFLLTTVASSLHNTLTISKYHHIC